ncbi:hypothetical protein [Rubritalea tangerina]
MSLPSARYVFVRVARLGAQRHEIADSAFWKRCFSEAEGGNWCS